MNRAILFSIVLCFGVFAVSSVSSQEPSEPRGGQGFGAGRGPGGGLGLGGGRGQGFRGGRGPGFGQGRGNRMHATTENKSARQYEKAYPVIANYGGVVQLPNAAQQPRPWTKLLVDLTSSSEADELNLGLEKVSKYLNIYAGGGAKPAEVKIAVIFHGSATLAVLNEKAYSRKFGTNENPNLEVIRSLNDAGVQLYVCGQTLISKGFSPEDVVESVDTAVSALTAVVNLQADGYAYIPFSQSGTASMPRPTSTAINTSPQQDQDHEPIARGAMGRGMGRGPGAMPGMQGDMSTLHAMFADRDKIRRTIKLLPDGAEAVTESNDDAIADLIREHVPAMEDRVLGNQPLPPMTFHPVFVNLIKHADDYTLTHEETEKGIKVTYQSDDPFVVMLVQEHAKLVSRFIKNGMEEIHKPYTLPTTSQGSDQ